jgi:hypothetical protein
VSEPRSPRRPLTLPRKVGFTAFVLLLFLVLSEVGLQIAAWKVGPQGHYPDGIELPTPDPSSYRVVAVGDSWVFGAESQPHEAFIEVFARARAEAGGRPVQIFNLGVPGSNSAQALVSLNDVIELIDPDLVVALTGSNDQIHDRAVADAALLINEDARMNPGWTLLSKSRVALGARLAWVNLRGSGEEAAVDAVLDSAQQGGAGLPRPPASRAATVYLLPWWDLYRQRRWQDALVILRALPEPANSRQRGLQKAWEALLLAHLDDAEASEDLARQALDLGGDRATAWEARAITALRQDRPLHALHARLRAVDTAPDDGNPYIRERALGLALLELEAWEAAEAWLMGCEMAVAGNLEVLMGLARLSGAARTDAAEEALFTGPRGAVTPEEYYEWHLASSGFLDRAAGSLGTEDPGESSELQLYRGRAAEASGEVDAARMWFLRVLAREDARTVDLDRAVAGLVRTRPDGARLHAVVPEDHLDRLSSVSAAPAVVAAQRANKACISAIALGQTGLVAGMSTVDLEQSLGDCVPSSLVWSLVEQAIASGAVVDRASLVLGLRPGGRPLQVPGPTVQRWDLFLLRDLDAFARRNDPSWQAFAAAHQGRWADLPELLGQAAEVGDPAVVELARALEADAAGRWRDAWNARSAAAGADGSPWARTLARGTLAAQGGRWTEAQADLLAVLAVAPGYLEALEPLSLVPPEHRNAGTNLALRYAPSGKLSADRWADWYLSQDRVGEAEAALHFSQELAPAEALSVALAEGRVAQALEVPKAARAAFSTASEQAERAGLRDIGCRALAWRYETAPTAPDAAVLQAACADHPDALLAALDAAAGSCDVARPLAVAALVGADPLDVVDRAGSCLSAEDAAAALNIDGLPPWSASWLTGRLGPVEAAVSRTNADRSSDRLVRHLDSMAKLSEAQGSRFVALTYPFPGTHHQRVRERIASGSATSDFELLDLYEHFDRTFDPDTWQGMRTPQDHVDATGYAEMGRALEERISGNP